MVIEAAPCKNQLDLNSLLTRSNRYFDASNRKAIEKWFFADGGRLQHVRAIFAEAFRNGRDRRHAVGSI